MRFLLLTFLSVLVVSCGDKGSSSSNNANGPQRQQAPTGNHNGNGTGTIVSPNEYTSDVKETDLLDVAMDVPVEISGSKIIFKQTVSNAANGIRSTCSANVTSGEAYDYKVAGSTLSIRTASGQAMDLSRVSGNDGSIVGSWTGKQYVGDQFIIRRMTFVSENRLVMRTHCEG